MEDTPESLSKKEESITAPETKQTIIELDNMVESTGKAKISKLLATAVKAIETNNLEALKLNLKAISNIVAPYMFRLPSVNAIDSFLHYSAANSTEIALWFLSDDFQQTCPNIEPLDIETKTNGTTLLWSATLLAGRVELVERLLQLQASPTKFFFGLAEHANPGLFNEVLPIYLQYQKERLNKDVNQFYRGLTPLGAALIKKNYFLAEKLLSLGAKLDLLDPETETTILLGLIEKDVSSEALEWLFQLDMRKYPHTKLPNINHLRKNREPVITYLALMNYTTEESLAIMKLMLSAGANVTWQCLTVMFRWEKFEHLDFLFSEECKHHFPNLELPKLFGSEVNEESFLINIQDMIEAVTDCFADPEEAIELLQALINLAKADKDTIKSKRNYFSCLSQSRSHSIWQLFTVITGNNYPSMELVNAHIPTNSNALRYLLLDTADNATSAIPLPSGYGKIGENVSQIAYPYVLHPELAARKPDTITMDFRYFNTNQAHVVFPTICPDVLPAENTIQITFSNSLKTIRQGFEKCSGYRAENHEIQVATMILLMREKAQLEAKVKGTNALELSETSDENKLTASKTAAGFFGHSGTSKNNTELTAGDDPNIATEAEDRELSEYLKSILDKLTLNNNNQSVHGQHTLLQQINSDVLLRRLLRLDRCHLNKPDDLTTFCDSVVEKIDDYLSKMSDLAPGH